MKPISTIAVSAVLVALAPAAPAKTMPTVTITLTSHAFAPDPIRLAADRPVRLIFLNRAGKGHDFTAPRFFRSARLLGGRAPGGEIDLAGGRGAVVDLVPRSGVYKVHCGHFGHKQLGMKTRIIVE